MYPWIIDGLSMDLLTSDVIAHNVSMDYPRLSMDHPTSKVVAIPVIRKYNVSVDSQVESNIQVCYGSNPSNSGIQCMIIHGSSQRWTLT